MTAVVTRGAYGPVYRVGIAGAKGYAEAQATFYPGRVGWRLNVYHFDDLHAFDALVETVKQLATQEKEIVLDWEHERLVKHEAPKSYRSDWE